MVPDSRNPIPPDADGAPGRLVLAATPLGNVGDVSPRLAAVLASADVVAAEDTRRLRRLASDLGITVRGAVVSYFAGNEAARTPSLLARLREGATVVLVTDAGMPAVSDPGYLLVRAAIEGGVPVTVVPGPSAVLAALAVSGLPVDRFCFEGFLSRKAGERSSRLRDLAAESRTLVFFESPRRLAATLAAMTAAFGADRPAAVCRELTKVHEEVRRGTLTELAEWAAGGVLGEITLVIAGSPSGAAPALADPAELARLVAVEVAAGRSRRDAVDAVAHATGAPRRAVYQASLSTDSGEPPR